MAKKMSSGEEANLQTLPLVAGIDLGGTQIRAAVLRGPRVYSRVATLTGENPTPERVLPRIYSTLQQALDEARASLDEIAALGVASPGPLNNRTGVIYSPPNLPAWKGVPLLETLREKYQKPVYVEHDA